MKKKINPKDQSEKLRQAKLEFILRNGGKSQNFKKLFERNKKKRDEITTALATNGEKFNKEQKERWDFLYQEAVFDKELAALIKKEIPPNAVNAVWRWLDYNMAIQYQRMGDEQNYDENGIVKNLSPEEIRDQIIYMYCQDARGIFTELMNDRPAVHLLLGVDLTRNKEVILAEVEKLVDEYKTKLGVHEARQKRFKWLPALNEILEVWDLYEQAGQQPVKITFKDISRKVKRPLSTVKDQWRIANEKIYREPYNPESKHTNEEKKAEATKLCAKCPHDAKCYSGKDWHPCAEYAKIAGKDKYEKHIEYRDQIDYDEYEKHSHKKKKYDE